MRTTTWPSPSSSNSFGSFSKDTPPVPWSRDETLGMRALAADDPWQEVPLRRLEARIEEKLAWSSRAISRRPGQDPAAARATIESGEAGRLMEQIRHDLRIMREEAERLFAART